MPPCEEKREPITMVTRRYEEKLTMATVAKHNTPDDCWIVINDKVYDASLWVNDHPGGSQVIKSFAGMDVTDAYLNSHAGSAVAFSKLRTLYVGDLAEPAPVDALALDQRELAKKLLRNGLYKTDYFWYLKIVARLTLFWLVSYYLIGSRSGDWISQWIPNTTGRELISAFCFAMFFQQLAFIGHDVGHNAVTHNRHMDSALGLIGGNFLTGVNIGWWKATHNMHHVLTNSCDFDPDIQHLPIFAVSSKLFNSIYSHYHDKVMKFDGIAKVLVSYQHITFWPVMAFARFNLYIQSILFSLLRPTSFISSVLEIGTLIGFWIWFSKLFLARAEHPLFFLITSHCLAGILHVQICISHFAMETYLGRIYENDAKQEDFFRRQLATSMNIRSDAWTRWFYGGLDFQIEHHLYPRLPRHNLWKIQDDVMALCKKHNIPYHCVGWWSAIGLTVDALRNVANKASVCEGMMWKGLNAFG